MSLRSTCLEADARGAESAAPPAGQVLNFSHRYTRKLCDLLNQIYGPHNDANSCTFLDFTRTIMDTNKTFDPRTLVSCISDEGVVGIPG